MVVIGGFGRSGGPEDAGIGFGGVVAHILAYEGVAFLGAIVDCRAGGLRSDSELYIDSTSLVIGRPY